MLITKLTGKVEANDEVLGQLRELVEKSDHDLKLETERFNLRLTESQRYFEETLKEQEENLAKLRKVVQDKEGELLVAENDLREIISRHERDVEKIMSKGEVNIQDTVIQMLEQKLKDTNEVLEGKLKVIEVLQKESTQKEKELMESREIQKSFKEKLQQMTEQIMLTQSYMEEKDTQILEERKKFQTKMHDLVEKHESESTEKDIQIQSLKSSAEQLESAYNQSLSQYEALQGRYDQLINHGDVSKSTGQNLVKSQGSESAEGIDTLHKQIKEKDQQLEELECLQQKTESLSNLLRDKEEEIEDIKKQLEDKTNECEKLLKQSEESATGSGSKGGDTKMLKVKAQLTAKIKGLEKEISELKKVCALS